MSDKKLRGERKTSVQAETPEQSLQLLKWEIENNYKRKRDEALNFSFHWDKGVYDKDLHEDTLDSLGKVAGEPYIKQYPPGGLIEAWKEKYNNPQIVPTMIIILLKTDGSDNEKIGKLELKYLLLYPLFGL